MLDMIRNSIKDTPEAAALFYDELARIVQLGGIDPKIEVHSNFPQHSVPANNWSFSLRNRRQFATLPLVSSRNDVWETSAQISYWLRVTIHIRVVLLIGWSKISANQKHYPDPSSVASFVKFLRSLLRRHFVGKSPWWRRKMWTVFPDYWNFELSYKPEWRSKEICLLALLEPYITRVLYRDLFRSSTLALSKTSP